MKIPVRFLPTIVALAAGVAATTAQAQVGIAAPSVVYGQNFDTLVTGGAGQPWTNNATLPGWNLFVQPAPGNAVTSYGGQDGSSNSGGFFSFGSAGVGERALGGTGSGGAYFGSPPSGSLAGWIAAEFLNASGSAFGGFSLLFDGEQWRNGGNTSAQTMAFEYGFGSSFATVSGWIAPGGAFDWSSPVFGAVAAAVDGNAAGLAVGRGGSVLANWNAGDSLWLRWSERNDVGNDHGLAIDNLRFNALLPVPEPGGLAMMAVAVAGLVAAGARRRRSRGR